MANKLSLLCKYYATGDIDFVSYRQQRSIIINTLLHKSEDKTRPLSNRQPKSSEDTTLRDPVHAMQQASVTVNTQRKAPAIATKTQAPSLRIKILITVLLLIPIALIGSYFLYTTANTEQPSQASFTKALPASPLKIALYTLIDQKSWWSAEQMSYFISTWDNASVAERKVLRLDSRYSQLMSDILAYEAVPDELNQQKEQQLAALKSRVRNNY